MSNDSLNKDFSKITIRINSKEEPSKIEVPHKREHNKCEKNNLNSHILADVTNSMSYSSSIKNLLVNKIRDQKHKKENILIK